MARTARALLLLLGLPVLTAAAAHATPVHGHADMDSAPGTGLTVVRSLVLLAVVALAAWALLRPFLPSRRRTGLVVAATAAVAVLGDLVLAAATPTIVLVAAGLTIVPLMVPALARQDEPYRRLAPWVLTAGTVLASAVLAHTWLTGPDDQVQLLWSGVLIAVIALSWSSFCVPRTRRSTAAVHGQSAALSVVMMAGAATAAIAGMPAAPVPGLPLFAQVGEHDGVNVLVVPNRPGWNLVHVHGDGAEVGTDQKALVRAQTRPATQGTWAAVQLPAGSSRLWVKRDGRVDSFPVNPGENPGAAQDLTGPDGPECASALLSRALSAAAVDMTCPANKLDGTEAAALRGIVHFLAGRDVRTITLVTDSSTRSAAAELVVREAVAAAGITVHSPDAPQGPVVVVAGWATAEEVLRRIADGQWRGEGSYLAPWLLTEPLLNIPAGQLLPLRFTPAGRAANDYLTALRSRFPGETPSGTGYAGWSSGRRDQSPMPNQSEVDEPVRLYAASRINLQIRALDHRHGEANGWFPGGAITAVTGPLPTH